MIIVSISPGEHKLLVAFVESLVAKDPPLDTPEGTALLLLATIVSKYEEEHFPMGAPPYDAASATGMYDPEG